MKNLLLCGTITDKELVILRSMVMRAHPWRARDWQVIVGDGYGLEAEVLRFCMDEHIRYRVYGINVRPTNSAPLGHYERVIVPNRNQRYEIRNRYMLAQAQRVVVFHDHPILSYAKGFKPIYHYDGHWVEIPLAQEAVTFSQN